MDEDSGRLWNLQKKLQKEIIPGVVLIAVYSAEAVFMSPEGVPGGDNTTDCFSSYSPVVAALCRRRGL